MMRRGNDSMNAPEHFFTLSDALGIAPDAFARFVTSAVRVINPDEFIMLVNHDLQQIGRAHV